MRDEHFELKPWIVVVAFDPVNHVAPIARSGGADAIPIHVRQRGRLRHAILDINEDLPAPVTRDLTDQLLAIAS